MTSEVTQADWATVSDWEIVAEVSALQHLSPNRNATLIQEMCRRFEVRLAHRGGEVVAWQGIKSAPKDEQILAAIKVHHKNGEIWWEQHIIVIDSETGEIRDMDFHHGWEAEDYEAWQPLPTPPQALGEQP